MHPHLSNLQACSSIAEELEMCRESGFFAKYFGGCNDVKAKLVMCLRKERIERTSRHIEQSRRRNNTPEAAWKRHVTLDQQEQEHKS